jgi:hypothetical protein
MKNLTDCQYESHELLFAEIRRNLSLGAREREESQVGRLLPETVGEMIRRCFYLAVVLLALGMVTMYLALLGIFGIVLHVIDGWCLRLSCSFQEAY